MADANTKAERSEADTEGVHRLRDIVVEEVSLVDRPANQRRFLVVKRNDATDDDQARRTIDKAKKKPGARDEDEDEDEDKKKAAKKPFGRSGDDDDEDENKNKKKAAKKPFGRSGDDDDEDEDEDEDKKKAAKKPFGRSGEDEDEEDAEKARGSSNGDDEDDEDDQDDQDGKATPPWKRKQQRNKTALVIAAHEKAAVLGAVTKALERLMTLAKRVQGATERDGETSGVPEVVGTELGAIAELLSIERRKNAPAEIAKAGARMAKDRLAKFQQALTLLADILSELTNAQAGGRDDAKAAAKSDVSKRDPTSPATIEIPGLTDLVSGLGELTSIVKRQEEELVRFRKTRVASNAISVEGTRRVEADVSWPIDMNRPISRDKVRKDVSFFDE